MNNDEFELFRDRMYEMVRYFKKSGYFVSEDSMSTIAENYAQCLRGMAEKIGVDNVLKVGQVWVKKDVSDRRDVPKPAKLVELCQKEYAKLLNANEKQIEKAQDSCINNVMADGIVKCRRILNNAEQLKELKAMSPKELCDWLEEDGVDVDLRNRAEWFIEKEMEKC